MSHLRITGMQADAVAAPSHGTSAPADSKGEAVEAVEHFQQVKIRHLLIAASKSGLCIVLACAPVVHVSAVQMVLARSGIAA